MGKRIYSDDIEWTLKLNLQEFIKSVEKSGKKLTDLRQVLNFTGEDFKHLQNQVDYPISSFSQLVDVLSQNHDLTFGFDNAEYESFYHLIDELHVAIPQFERVDEIVSSLGLTISDLSNDNDDLTTDLINVEDEISNLDERSKGYFIRVKEFFDNLRSRKNIVGDIYSELKYWQKRVNEFTKKDDIFGLNYALNQVQILSNNLSGITERDIFTKSGKFVKKHAIHEETITHNINDAYLNIDKSNIDKAEFEIKKYEELIRYQSDVYNRLLELRNHENLSLTQNYQILEELSKSLNLIVEYKDKLSDAFASMYSSMYQDSTDAVNAFYDNLSLSLEKHLSDDIKLQEQTNILLLQNELQHNNDLLRAAENYRTTVQSSEQLSESKRIELLKNSDKEIRKLKQQQLKSLVAIQQKVAEMTSDPIGLEGLERNLEREKAAVAAAYDAMVEVARQNGLETVELERSKLQKLRDLEFEYQEELWGIKERLGVNWQEEYDHEVSLFRKMLDDELISQSQFEKKLFELRVLNAKKWFDYYHGLSGSMFSAIQQAEIDQSDAKYDVLIRQAENAGEDTAALEEEKENKKLEIQKKYADVDFAIKASQIVADTAVAIMKTWAQLGWPAGVIGAAFIAATGTAQLISAKAERDRIKNLQPRNSDFSNEIPSAERVLSGYSEGGYTGDGRRLEVAGVVHRGEYVVPQPIMGDPRVVDAVGMIEAIRRQRRGLPGLGGVINAANVTGGFAEGGYTGGGGESLAGVAAELRAATEAVRNLRAYIVYQDIERAGEVLTAARAPFTRKK